MATDTKTLRAFQRSLSRFFAQLEVEPERNIEGELLDVILGEIKDLTVVAPETVPTFNPATWFVHQGWYRRGTPPRHPEHHSGSARHRA